MKCDGSIRNVPDGVGHSWAINSRALSVSRGSTSHNWSPTMRIMPLDLWRTFPPLDAALSKVPRMTTVVPRGTIGDLVLAVKLVPNGRAP